MCRPHSGARKLTLISSRRSDVALDGTVTPSTIPSIMLNGTQVCMVRDASSAPLKSVLSDLTLRPLYFVPSRSYPEASTYFPPKGI